jgi:uracil-DNA glycosylase
MPSTGNLTQWAQQGVLLLNSVLTVRAYQSASHKNIGWEECTDEIIKAINKKDDPVVFMLWGNFAKKKAELITNPKHLVLTSGHPSPLSCRYFFGNNHFKKCNEFLEKNGKGPIDWTIE